jgi:hypothetical protein
MLRPGFVVGALVGLVVAGGIAFVLATAGGGDGDQEADGGRLVTLERGLRGEVAKDYEMFSDAGDRALAEIMEDAAQMLHEGAKRQDVLDMIKPRYSEVAERHEEAFDTAVRDAFADELDRHLERAGYAPVDAHSDFVDLGDEQ